MQQPKRSLPEVVECASSRFWEDYITARVINLTWKQVFITTCIMVWPTSRHLIPAGSCLTNRHKLKFCNSRVDGRKFICENQWQHCREACAGWLSASPTHRTCSKQSVRPEVTSVQTFVMQKRVGSDQWRGRFARRNLNDEQSGNKKKEHRNTANCNTDRCYSQTDFGDGITSLLPLNL